jgi:hypothetical protein
MDKNYPPGRTFLFRQFVSVMPFCRSINGIRSPGLLPGILYPPESPLANLILCLCCCRTRYATLVALAVEGTATVTDEIIDLHDRIIGKLFNTVKDNHQQQFHASGKAINDRVRMDGRIGQALIEAKQSGDDPFAAIEVVIQWGIFAAIVIEAQKLARPADFDFLHHINKSYATLRRYAPEFLSVLKPRWAKLVLTDKGIDWRYYELCALSELKNALRSGNVWVQGSRQFKDFDEYLVPVEKFVTLKLESELPLAVTIDCDQYLLDRLELLETQLSKFNRMAGANDLPDARRVRVKTAWQFRYGSWDALSARCSSWTGCKASSCVAASRLASTKVKRGVRWLAPCSSTVWVKSAIAVSNSSVTGPAASIW